MYKNFWQSVRKIPEEELKQYDEGVFWWADANIMPNRLSSSKKDKEKCDS